MLGKTAGGLFWMFRYLERAENTARLVDAGFRIALTRPSAQEDEWSSILLAAGSLDAYHKTNETVEASRVINFLLRDRRNPSSVLSVLKSARDNGKLVRTALTRETWEAINECWITVGDALSRQIRERELPNLLSLIRQQTGLVRAANHGTMLRNDIFDFGRIGTFLERADNTARILDVKYYVLLPSVSLVGSKLDNVQWEMILRSVSANRSYRWLNGGDINPRGISEFLILDGRQPRSLAFCLSKITDNLGYLEADYGTRHECHDLAEAHKDNLKDKSVDEIFEQGLHEFIGSFLSSNNVLGRQIEKDFRFYE